MLLSGLCSRNRLGTRKRCTIEMCLSHVSRALKVSSNGRARLSTPVPIALVEATIALGSVPVFFSCPVKWQGLGGECHKWFPFPSCLHLVSLAVIIITLPAHLCFRTVLEVRAYLLVGVFLLLMIIYGFMEYLQARKQYHRALTGPSCSFYTSYLGEFMFTVATILTHNKPRLLSCASLSLCGVSISHFVKAGSKHNLRLVCWVH